MTSRGPSLHPLHSRPWPGWLAVLLGLWAALCAATASAADPARSFLTAQEREWIDRNAASIRLAPESNYPPFSFLESGVWRGLSADVVALIQDRTGARFQILPPQNLDAILDHARQGSADIVTSIKETPERSQFLAFTQPYFRVPTAIIVKSSLTEGRWPEAFVGKRVAVGKGYGVQKFIEQKFPSIKLTLVADDLQGMRQLSFGEVDAIIMDVASASFFIEREKFSNLRVFSEFDFTYDLSLAVRKDLPILREILSKTLLTLSDKDIQAVSDNWIKLSHDHFHALLDKARPWLVVGTGVGALLLAAMATASRARRRRQRVALQASQYSRSLIEASLDPLVTISAQGKITDVNTATEQVTGVARSKLVGSDFADYFTDPVQAREGYQQVFAQGFVTDYPLAIRHTSGSITDVLYNASVYRDDAGKVLGVFAAARDVTERKKAERYIQAASVFTHAREGIMITSADGTILNVNHAFTSITGYSHPEVIGKNPRLLKSGQHDKAFYLAMWHALTDKGHWYGEIRNRRKNGEVFIEALTITAVYGAGGVTEQYVALFSDVTAVREHQNQLEFMAHFDALTKLPNRLLLSDRIQQGLAHSDRRGQTLAIVYLDLDGFKAINDQHGHEVGDQLLVALADRMNQVLREADTLARIGGDEFVAILVDLTDAEASGPMLERLLTAAAQPVQLADLTLQVSASLGVTFSPQEQTLDADQLLRQADQAMYQAKLAGKNRYHIFDAKQDSHIRIHHESVERIRLAASRREFVLYYQPKVNMRSGKVVGTEALIRWQHPERGLLAPALFLPVIEDHPLAVAIGEWVIDTALAQVDAWRAAGLDLPVSVNVGSRQLQQPDFVSRLRSALAIHPELNPSCLEIEILETSALQDIAQVSRLIEDCTRLGVRFTLDDFGTGYSSLTYLKRLRIETLKIDRSFVSDMLIDADAMAILKGVIGLAAAFKRQVIAEGVETAAHGAVLLQLGCELAQGYGIAYPMPASEIAAWTAAWQPDPAWRTLH